MKKKNQLRKWRYWKGVKKDKGEKKDKEEKGKMHGPCCKSSALFNPNARSHLQNGSFFSSVWEDDVLLFCSSTTQHLPAAPILATSPLSSFQPVPIPHSLFARQSSPLGRREVTAMALPGSAFSAGSPESSTGPAQTHGKGRVTLAKGETHSG